MFRHPKIKALSSYVVLRRTIISPGYLITEMPENRMTINFLPLRLLLIDLPCDEMKMNAMNPFFLFLSVITWCQLFIIYEWRDINVSSWFLVRVLSFQLYVERGFAAFEGWKRSSCSQTLQLQLQHRIRP